MNKNKIYMSNINIGCYLLRVDNQINLEELDKHFAKLKSFDPEQNAFAIEYSEYFENSQVLAQQKQIIDTASKHGMQLIFIVLNEFSKNIKFNYPAIKVHSTSTMKPIEQVKPSNSTNKKTETLVINEVVRTGSSISNNGDIILTDRVGDQAEIVSSGNISVFGTNNGNLIAGHPNDTSAIICVNDFRGGIVSIAGVYKHFDAIKTGAIKFSLTNNKLEFNKI